MISLAIQSTEGFDGLDVIAVGIILWCIFGGKKGKEK